MAIAHTQGDRGNDEDAFCSTSISLGKKKVPAQFHGIFDGHGDNGKCAQYIGYYLPKRLEQVLSEADELDDETITDALIH